MKRHWDAASEQSAIGLRTVLAGKQDQVRPAEAAPWPAVEAPASARSAEEPLQHLTFWG